MLHVPSYNESAVIQPSIPAIEGFIIPADLNPLLINAAQKLMRRYSELTESLRDEQPVDEDSRPHYSNHLAEDASDAQDWQSRAAVAHHISGELQATEHAFILMQRGQYGQCEHCAHMIPPRRLEIIPSATLCVNCQGRADTLAMGH